jgi:glucose/arabinose dehydrogenase
MSSPAATARGSTSTVGSNSNVAEHGMEKEINRAAILRGRSRQRPDALFASGCATRTGLDWQPQSGALWTVVN